MCKIAIGYECSQLRHLWKDSTGPDWRRGTREVGVYLRVASGTGNFVLANKNFGHAKSGPYAPQDIKRGDRFLTSVIFTLPLKLSHLRLGPSWVSLVMGKASQLGISIGLFGVGSFKIPLSQGNSLGSTLQWNAGKEKIWCTLWLVYPSASSLVHVPRVSPLLGYDLSGFCSLFKASLQWLFKNGKR